MIAFWATFCLRKLLNFYLNKFVKNGFVGMIRFLKCLQTEIQLWSRYFGIVVVQLVWQLFNKIWVNFVQSSGRTASKERCLKGKDSVRFTSLFLHCVLWHCLCTEVKQGTFIKHKNKLKEGSSEKAEQNKFLKIISKIFYCFDLS